MMLCFFNGVTIAILQPSYEKTIVGDDENNKHEDSMLA
jgi:hypothetical protein